MSMKKFDLAKNMGLKIESQRRAAGVPSRFAQEAGTLVDRREQRRRDAEAGLMPFACKLPAALIERLRVKAADHPGGMNALVEQLLAAQLPGDATD
jgi:hypothetical protein